MFGSAKRHGDQTGHPPCPQDSTQFILDKIEELDERLTKQMACEHGPFEYKFAGGFGPAVYRKTCQKCGLEMDLVSMREKMEEELAQAKADVERLESAIARNFPEAEE